MEWRPSKGTCQKMKLTDQQLSVIILESIDIAETNMGLELMIHTKKTIIIKEIIP